MSNAWSFLARWLRLRRYLLRWARDFVSAPVEPEPPLRAALFNAEQMQAHGQALARSHVLRRGRTPDLLLTRLAQSEALLDDARDLLTRMAQDDIRITPAGDWLLDNYYLIEEQIRTARLHLPKGYSRELPVLDAGPAAGLPRVFDIAKEAIAHGDGRVDEEIMSRYVAAYQSVTPLQLRELWAIPIMLRLALIENLRRMSVRVMRDSADHRLAAEWAARLNDAAEREPKNIVLVLADMVRSGPPLSGPFVAGLMRGLHGASTVLAMPIGWIEQWAADGGHGVEELIHAESQQQAADQVSVSNSIGSLRFLATMDWREFVETMSVVDRNLRDDPTGIYAWMDFNTRDAYRHVVETIARRSGVDEVAVARAVLALAREHAPDEINGHVGYYLIDQGLAQTRKTVARMAARRRRLWLRPRSVPLFLYLLPIGLLLAFFTSGLMSEVLGLGLPTADLCLLAVLAVVVFSELGIALVNWAATVIVAPQRLPRMDYSGGIPADSRSLVVVPTMFGDRDGIDALVESLEVRFLANRDPHLHFALLTDFLDADQETLPGDAALLDHAVQRIDALNAKYAHESADRFFLFQRPRLWNASERRWIGYERKRGKLEALNHLLRGGGSAAFMRIAGNTEVLANVRYVITLDTDTRLPRDAAREFAATLAHPLNHARFDPKRRRVVRGYGILQPTVGASMSGRQASRFARVFGSEAGIDPYTRMVSDVYQDLFGEGSFFGKGIYDVDAFEQALAGRFPDNRILSHDLLEGCYARAGLVSDVRLYEDYPARYAVDVKRRSRWIRGDWQLLPWLLPWVPRRDRGYESNPLSWLSRGKLLDNLRRSLVPASATALLVIGWLLLSDPLMWTIWLVCLLLLPVLIPAIRDLLEKPADMAMETHVLQVIQGLLRGCERAAIELACLPYEAAFSLAAIARSLWRMLVSGRHLLQWNPSSEVERSLAGAAGAELRGMVFAPAFAIATGVALLRVNPSSLWIAGPVLVLWLLSPALMAWLGRPPRLRQAALSASRIAFLRALARRTWAFFEVSMRAEDHWLPPDNLQEHPAPLLARRTSPTNIGLSLLAALAAHDFGYLTTAALIERLERTLATLQRLPRHRGHFYNWYDTQTLEALAPRYISSVDSGNLAGHLLTLRQGLLALVDAPAIANPLLEGIADTFAVLDEDCRRSGPAGETMQRALDAFATALDASRSAAATGAAGIAQALDALLTHAEAISVAWPAAAADGEVDSLHWPLALVQACSAGRDEALRFAASDTSPQAQQAGPTLRECLHAPDAVARVAAEERIQALERLADVVGECALMEFGFLYDRARHLLSIGYNVDERRLDPGYYDLLASEARLCCFVAIAQGQLPEESWFALGRLLTDVDGEATLLSWSGSMFEYLMPQLVMPSYPDTLLDQTARHAVRAQIHYGAQRGVPWGISESGYNAVDARMNYQYRAFGVPGLGLKRGLGQDLVVAPYASMMALMVAPEAACENLLRLTASGFGGRFGLHEAIDYTPARIPPGQDHALVRSYMAHHQGMGLLALAHLLREKPMQRRFNADPEFQATLLLLQERIPRTGVFHPHEPERDDARQTAAAAETQLRVFTNPQTSRPAVQLLSNGRYHALLSSAGGGYSRLRDMAVTRWREDGTRDPWGSFCYLRDVENGDYWSAAYQPACVPVARYEAIFSDAKAEFRGRRHGYDMHLEIAVSAEDDIELRRLHVANRSARRRTIEITTYAEVVLAPAISDELHPVFSNLFVQTEIVRERQAIVCTRRPRSREEIPPWMFHLVAVHEADVAAISYETDRALFLGRGNTARTPRALTTVEALSDSDGSVLDPIVAIRTRLTLAPEQGAVIDMVTGVGTDRAACALLIDKYRDRHLADRVFDLAWTHSEVVRRQINASQADARLFERLAGLMVYAHPFLRAASDVLLQNRRGQSGLWGHQISGDLPIVLLQVTDAENFELVRQMVQAHAYWRLKGLETDLVIWNDERSGYRQNLQDQILGLIGAGPESHMLNQRGGIFVRAAHQITQEDRILVQSVARVVLNDAAGKLAAQVGRHVPRERSAPLLSPERGSPAATMLALDSQSALQQAPIRAPAPSEDAAASRGESRQFDNGVGGFAADGREYVIVLREGAPTPAPWANVMANARIGSVVSESAAGYTWFENAHEFRLTPWYNDPVADASGEAFYLRDEETGLVWSPLPLPCRGSGSYRTRHGFGYSVYEHVEDGIASEVCVFVALEDAVKYTQIKLRNRSGRARRLSLTGYVEWVLGDLRARSHMHVASETDGAGAMLARNPYNVEFPGRTAFFDVDADERSCTADRVEFLGRNGDLGAPAALQRAHLSGRLGVGLDPCAALQLAVDLAADATFETCFRLGAAVDFKGALDLARRSRGAAQTATALDDVRRHWRTMLGSLEVETPEPGIDLLVNGWLVYQTLACRYFARSGYYQSGGAFGFRDQLQDTMATVHAAPQLTREHLLLSAAHQFVQGDVLHWWHPPIGRGVRTRCSDDYLWLPLAVCRYVEVTGDHRVLDERVRYIDGRALNADEESHYDLPVPVGRQHSLYEHCVLALERGMQRLGERGLPLIGSGDWNDGMNRVGIGGRGESVWLGFFLSHTLDRFGALARGRGQQAFADRCAAAVQTLGANLEMHAWDGRWYRRAWFDDGTPLGSAQSEDCRIDSISQSWAVLSGAADPARAREAMASLDEFLVRRDAGLIALLTPPFDSADQDPGYIRGYVPGVRENGGQYTHAAVWAAMAFAALGETGRAWDLVRMINPVDHARDAEGVARYKVEPYVLAADVYAVPPHTGRGGWTWYTGSAGWLYRLLTESLLGLQRRGDRMRLAPCVPAHWPHYRLRYRYGESQYVIAVRLGDAAQAMLRLDGIEQPSLEFPLVDDRSVHDVELDWPRDLSGSDSSA